MCDSGADEKKLRVFKIFRPDCGDKNCWITTNWDAIPDSEFDGSEPGDRIIVELAEMTQAQIDALPEFVGW